MGPKVYNTSMNPASYKKASRLLGVELIVNILLVSNYIAFPGGSDRAHEADAKLVASLQKVFGSGYRLKWQLA